MNHFPIRIAALAVAIGLALSACASSEESTSTTTSSSTSTTTSSTVTSAPTTTTVPASDQFAVVYGQGATTNGAVDLVLDLYAPEGTQPDAGWPAAVLIHGGGFRGGTREHEAIVQWAETLAADGYVVVSIDYRLEGDGPVVQTPQWQSYLESVPLFASEAGQQRGPAVVVAAEDAITATEWLISDSGFDIDESSIVVGGGSAGAITAVHVAYLPDDIGLDAPSYAAVIDHWGGFIGTPGDASAIGPGSAPIFIVHGTDDATVAFSYAEDLAAQAEAVGVRFEFHPRQGAGHGFRRIDIFSDTTADGVALIDAQLAFLDEVLKRG